MRMVGILVISFLAGAFASAQHRQPAAAVKLLHKADRDVAWSGKSATVADFDCDGAPDTAIFGTTKGAIVVAVVWGGKGHRRPDLITFAMPGNAQNAFCAAPTHIRLMPLDCQSELGLLPGCKPSRTCRAFWVDDDECDAFNFYWNAVEHRIAWWRL